MQPLSNIRRRQIAAQATVDKFFNSELKWGELDCVHMAAFAMQQLGYPDPLRDIRHYETLGGGIKALKKSGYASFEDALDQMGFERIPPAAALPADIIALPAEGEWRSLGIALGQQRALAYIGIEGQPSLCRFGPLDEIVAAWRVPPAELV